MPAESAALAACLGVLCAAAFTASAQDIRYQWHPAATPQRLTLQVDGRALIDTGGESLHGTGSCAVAVTPQPLTNGVRLAVTVRNPGAEPAVVPEFRIPGIALPRAGTQRLDTWKMVQWTAPMPEQGGREGLHALRTYPLQGYSPLTGLRSADRVIGAAFIYDVFGLKWEIHPNYRYDREMQSWTLLFRPSTGEVQQEPGRGRYLEDLALEPGTSASFSLALQIATPGHWLEAFTAYRDHFRQTFGTRRHRPSTEPIFAYSLSSGPSEESMSEENPRAFAPHPVWRDGWKGFPEIVQEKALDHGFRRMMIWGSVGRYAEHPECNMAWEISTAWVPAQRATENEFRRLSEMGMTVGQWWGRALSISGGWDSGHRHPWDPDNPEDNAAAFRELDLAQERGVRLLGLDGTRRAVRPDAWNPGSDVAFQRIFPMLRERYPDMRWIIEAAANDYLHLWGSSFIWEATTGEPFVYADFLAPGAETHAGLKHNVKYLSSPDINWQRRFEELLFWGFTPIVFSDRQGRQVTVPQWQSPDAWPTQIVARAGALGVRFDGTAKWTLHRIDYNGRRLCIDTPGASYGTVANVRDIGFVGSGHVETGQEEQVLRLRLLVDGKPVDDVPAPSYEAGSIELLKESRIHHLRMIDRWRVAGDTLEEEVWLVVEEALPLNLLYTFMYPWTRTMTDYLAVTPDGERLSGAFEEDGSFKVQTATDWVAAYDREAGVGVVMDLLDVPQTARGLTRLWDKASPYKKHYLHNFTGQTLGPGDAFRFRARITPFRAPPQTWEETAAGIAAREG